MKRKTLIFILSFVFLFHCLTVFSPAQETIGKSGMVVSAHPIATEFGLEILKSGGNAVDAAVGTAIVIGVVEPNASGLGGGGAMLIYLKEADSLTYINYYARAPRLVSTNFNSETELSSGISVLVPGTVAGLYKALTQYGTISWKELLTKAVDRLKSGFKINSKFYNLIFDSYEKLMIYPETKSIYLLNDLPREQGSILKNDRLIKTLRKLADQGPDVFYQGEIADSIETVMFKYGGGIRKSDLKNYQPVEVSPIRGTYRNHEIISAPPPQCGITVIEILNILELKNLSQMAHFSGSAKTFHFMAEAMKRAYADRLTYLGDPKFISVPVSTLLSKGYAKSRFQTIETTRAFPARLKNTKPGNVTDFQKRNKSDDTNPHGSTTQISIADKFGNAVSLTQTLNHFWGSGISVCGFLLNNGMNVFSKINSANTINSGRIPRSTMAPTLVFKENSLFMVVGSPGAGRIPSTIVEVISNIIDYGYSPEKANEAPRFCSRKWADYITVEARIPDEVLNELRKMGHPIEVKEDMDLFFGGVQLILMDAQKNIKIGSSDPRRSGVAMGY